MRKLSITSLFTFAVALAVGCVPVDFVDDQANAGGDGAPAPSSSSGSKAPAPASGASVAPPAAPPTTDLHFSAKGNPKDQAVVFIHGGPGANSMMFELTVQEAIADLGYYVVAYDQRGSTRSPQGSAADYSFAKSTQDLDDLIGALGLNSPILLAHSFGGSIALHYLDRFAGHAKGAVLVSSPMSFPATYDTTLAECDARYKMWGRFADAKKVEALRAAMFPNGVLPPFSYGAAEIEQTIACQSAAMLYFPPLPTAGDLAFGLQHARDGSVNAVNPAVGEGFQANDAVGHADELPLLAAHTKEVVGIYAPDWDVMFGREELDRIRANVRAYLTVPNAGHFIFMDQPEVFTKTAGQALARLE